MNINTALPERYDAFDQIITKLKSDQEKTKVDQGKIGIRLDKIGVGQDKIGVDQDKIGVGLDKTKNHLKCIKKEMERAEKVERYIIISIKVASFAALLLCGIATACVGFVALPAVLIPIGLIGISWSLSEYAAVNKKCRESFEGRLDSLIKD